MLHRISRAALAASLTIIFPAAGAAHAPVRPDASPQAVAAGHRHATIIPGHYVCYAYHYTIYRWEDDQLVFVREWTDQSSRWCEYVRSHPMSLTRFGGRGEQR